MKVCRIYKLFSGEGVKNRREGGADGRRKIKNTHLKTESGFGIICDVWHERPNNNKQQQRKGQDMKTKYIINSTGSTQGLCNPLRNLNGDEFDTRDAAVEAIYSAMYDVIDGENGCEMVERPNMKGLDDEEYLAAVEKYDADCHDFIRINGYAKEDGWTATIYEVAK